MAKDLAGKTIVVTGASAGIGRVTATDLGKRGARLILATRSEAKTRPLLSELGAEWVSLDLADLDSARRAAGEIAKKVEAIDVLVANAGVAGDRGTTKDGFEKHFGVNHLGHFVFIQRLLPLLQRAEGARVVIVASAAHYRAKNLDYAALRSPTKTTTGMREYQVSKLCNVLYARELAKRVKEAGIHVYAVHPGVIASELWRGVPWPLRPLIKLGMKTNEEGARSSIHCATSPEVAAETGLYYHEDCTPKRPSALARDDAVAAELWKKSEEWAAAHLGS